MHVQNSNFIHNLAFIKNLNFPENYKGMFSKTFVGIYLENFSTFLFSEKKFAKHKIMYLWIEAKNKPFFWINVDIQAQS